MSREHVAEEEPVVKAHRYFMLAAVLSLTAYRGESPGASTAAAAEARPATLVAGAAATDSDKCPLRAADLDKLTPHRWKVAQYQTDRAFPTTTIRIDFCELVGMDANGRMVTGVMVNVAVGANADAFAQHWRAACAGSIVPEARGRVQRVPGVTGGQHCVTADGSSSFYWLESAGRTIQIEPLTVGPEWATLLPQLLAAAAK